MASASDFTSYASLPKENQVFANASQGSSNPKSFIDFPTEVRCQILRELLGLEENRRERATEHLYNDINGEDLTPTRRGSTIQCSFPGLGILGTCKQLLREGMEVLLIDNNFVAVVGREAKVIDKLKKAGTLAYWCTDDLMWQDAWKAGPGYFDLRGVHGQILCHPFLTLTLERDCTDPPVLLPARDLLEAIYAAHETGSGSKVSPARDPLTLTFNLSRGPNRALRELKEDLVSDRLGEAVFFWLGNNVSMLKVFEPDKQSHAAMKAATEFEWALIRLWRGHSGPSRSDTNYDVKVVVDLMMAIKRMEEHLAAGSDGQAMLDFMFIGARLQVYLNGNGWSRWDDGMHRVLVKAHAHAQYCIAHVAWPIHKEHMFIYWPVQRLVNIARHWSGDLAKEVRVLLYFMEVALKAIGCNSTMRGPYGLEVTLGPYGLKTWLILLGGRLLRQQKLSRVWNEVAMRLESSHFLVPMWDEIWAASASGRVYTVDEKPALTHAYQALEAAVSRHYPEIPSIY